MLSYLGIEIVHASLRGQENKRKINGTRKFYSIGKNRKPLNSTTQSSGGLSL